MELGMASQGIITNGAPAEDQRQNERINRATWDNCTVERANLKKVKLNRSAGVELKVAACSEEEESKFGQRGD
jgi:hypothetical protein